MRVFITGATGFVGSAIVRELLDAGHHVLGLARSDAAARALAAAGGEVHRGSLEDHDSLKQGAETVDAVVHAAFNHDFSDFAASASADQLAIEALASALEGSGKPFIVTSGCLGIPTESDAPSGAIPRKSDQAGLAAAALGVRAMVVRLPPSVHGDGDHGFMPALIKFARETGGSICVGEGQNLWPAVHRLDAARLYRLALEQGTSGARYHAVADDGIPFIEIAQTIGRRLHVPVVSKTPEEAAALLGFIGHAIGMGGRSASALTRQRLGWHPTAPGLLHDLENGRYFDS